VGIQGRLRLPPLAARPKVSEERGRVVTSIALKRTTRRGPTTPREDHEPQEPHGCHSRPRLHLVLLSLTSHRVDPHGWLSSRIDTSESGAGRRLVAARGVEPRLDACRGVGPLPNPLPRAFTGTLPSLHLTVASTTSCLAEAEDPPRSCQLA
jgi:hypothetical protein